MCLFVQNVDKAGCETSVSQPIFLFGVTQQPINLKNAQIPFSPSQIQSD